MHAFAALIQSSHTLHLDGSMRSWLLYNHRIHDAAEHPVVPHRCTPFEPRTPCLSLSSCAHALHLAMPMPHAAITVTCFEQIRSDPLFLTTLL